MIWTINFKTIYILFSLLFLGQNKGKGGKNNMSGGKGGAHGKTFLICFIVSKLIVKCLTLTMTGKSDENYRTTSETI